MSDIKNNLDRCDQLPPAPLDLLESVVIELALVSGTDEELLEELVDELEVRRFSVTLSDFFALPDRGDISPTSSGSSESISSSSTNDCSALGWPSRPPYMSGDTDPLSSVIRIRGGEMAK